MTDLAIERNKGLLVPDTQKLLRTLIADIEDANRVRKGGKRLEAVIRLGGPKRQLSPLKRHPTSSSRSLEADSQAAALRGGSGLVVASSARSSASSARGNITALLLPNVVVPPPA